MYKITNIILFLVLIHRNKIYNILVEKISILRNCKLSPKILISLLQT